MGLFSSLFSRGFDDPKPMANEHLLSAIAGQADWLEKMSRAPIESQRSQSIVGLAAKRRNYIAQLCLEVISRGGADDGQPKYPGATKSINVFSETYDYSKELEASDVDVSKENAAIKAVKEKLFAANGVNYFTSWEV